MTQELSSSRPRPGATTPAAGGANISGSQASESLVEGGTTRAVPSAEGLAVVEAVKRDEAPVDPASDEIPLPFYDPRAVSLNADQRRLAELERDYVLLRDGANEMILRHLARIGELEESLAIYRGDSVVKESLTTAADILNAAAGHMAARASTYDKPGGERSMGKAVAMFNACVDRDLSEAEGWLLLQCLKDVRLFQRPGYHADSAEDCTAYSALKAEAKAREAS